MTLEELPMDREFYEVLSGEFSAASDPDQTRRHTLGKLAIATLKRGTAMQPDFYSYSPSWAPNTVAEILLLGSSIRTLSIVEGGTFVDGSSWCQFSLVVKPALSLVTRDSEGTGTIEPLAIGPELERLKLETAQKATDFYSRVAV